MDGSIQSAVSLLEESSIYDPPVLKNKSALFDLNGSWRLLYADASEITRLYQLPARFRPESVFQRVNIPRLTFENQAFLKGPLGTRGNIRVVSEFGISPKGSVNFIDKVNLAEDRIEVRFLAVILSLSRLGYLPLPFLKRVVRPRRASKEESTNGIGPSLDTTYLDGNIRVGRGGDGSLFVLAKDLNDPSEALSEDRVKKLRVEDKIFDAAQATVETIEEPLPQSKSLRDGVIPDEEASEPRKKRRKNIFRRIYRRIRGRPVEDEQVDDLNKSGEFAYAWAALRSLCKGDMERAIEDGNKTSIMRAANILTQYNPTLLPAVSESLNDVWVQVFASNQSGVLSGSLGPLQATVEVKIDVPSEGFSGEATTNGSAINPGGLRVDYNGRIRVLGSTRVEIEVPAARYQVFSTPLYLKSSRTGEEPLKVWDITYLDEDYLMMKSRLNAELNIYKRKI